MLSLFKELDFSSEIEQNKDLKVFILEACKKVQQEESEALRKIKKPELDDELLNQFIINGIPVLKPDNQEKFLALFKTKLLDAKKIGQKQGLLSIEVGRENGVGNQTLYMTYRSNAEAKLAFAKLNNFKFDKNHTLQCYSINEVRGFIEQQEGGALARSFQAPHFAPTKDKIQHNLDKQSRDQFLVREANVIYLSWLDHLGKSSKNALPSDFLSLTYAANKAVFSPLGSYLAVCSPQGTHLYFGSRLEYKGLLPQVGAIDAKFSPDERVLVTSNGGSTGRQNFIVWALEEQIKIKSYKSHFGQTLDCFQFSQDAQSLAVVLQSEVAVYSVGSLDEFKRQLKLPEEEQNIVKAVHVQRVAWLKGGWLIVMCYELDYNPVGLAATRIFLYNVQTKQERKWRAWSEHARNGQIFVSERGDWVAIALRKFIKKNHFATSIQIANLLRKEEPLEISSLEVKEEVDSISWDWHNNRFAVVSEDQATKKGINVRFVVSFYELTFRNKSLEIIKAGEIRDNLQNKVVLASNGNFFALYNTTEESPEKGKFSLGMITRENKEKGKRALAFEFTKQNLMVNGMNFFEVDPSGRFVLLGTEKGYQVWNFIGEIITKDTLQKNIADVHWRPRLLNQLPDEQERALLDSEKEIRKKYEEQDLKRINFSKWQQEEDKKKRKKEFFQYIAAKNEWFRQFADVRSKALGFKEFQVRTQKYEVSEGFIDIR